MRLGDGGLIAKNKDGNYGLLNSDTVVLPGYLENLVNAASSDERIACVMPMSNQCSFHSIDVPMGWNIFQYAASLRPGTQVGPSKKPIEFRNYRLHSQRRPILGNREVKLPGQKRALTNCSY